MRNYFSKKNILFFLLLVLLVVGTGFTDEPESVIDPKIKPGFSAIKTENVENYLQFLASDYLEGRDTASKGLHIAGDYVASLYKLWGVKPAGDIIDGKRSYFQYFPVVEYEYLDSSYLTISQNNGKTERKVKFAYRVDFLFGRGGKPMSQSIEAPVVFAGYGVVDRDLNYNDFANTDVKGKIVLILRGIPGEKNPKSPFYKKIKEGRRYFYTLRMNKFKELERRGAIACLMVGLAETGMSPFYYEMAMRDHPYIPDNEIRPPLHRMYIPNLKEKTGEGIIYLAVSERVADEMLASEGVSITQLQKKIDEAISPHSFELSGVNATLSMDLKEEIKTTRNLIGMIEGSDPVLKNEAIVIGGHYDHLGIKNGYVWNGADDNGSGTAAVMELVRAFTLNKEKPKRTIILALWSGEEKGLLGSRYYTVNHTIIPIEKAVVNINLDMFGRDIDPEDFPGFVKRNKKRHPFLADLKPEDAKKIVEAYGTIHCPMLKEITEEENKNVGLIPLVSLHERAFGSDQQPFFENRVPVIFFHSPVYTDYHQPSDTVEKINFDKVTKVAKLIYLISWHIDSLPERLSFTEPAKK
jgi:hypothetical protein